MDLRLQNQNVEKMLAFILALLAIIACVVCLQDRRRQKITAQERAFNKLQQRYKGGVEGDNDALRSDWNNVYQDIRNSYDKLIKERAQAV